MEADKTKKSIKKRGRIILIRKEENGELNKTPVTEKGMLLGWVMISCLVF